MVSKTAKLYLFYSEEELHNFSVKYLRKIADDKATLSKKELCRFLHFIIPRIPRVERDKGQVVVDDNGKFYRIVESNYHDDRLGILPVVFDLAIGNTYSYIYDLFTAKGLYFSKNVSTKNRVLLEGIEKTISYFSVEGTMYDLSEIYVLDDEVAKYLIKGEKFIRVPKKDI